MGMSGGSDYPRGVGMSGGEYLSGGGVGMSRDWQVSQKG